MRGAYRRRDVAALSCLDERHGERHDEYCHDTRHEQVFITHIHIYTYT